MFSVRKLRENFEKEKKHTNRIENVIEPSKGTSHVRQNGFIERDSLDSNELNSSVTEVSETSSIILTPKYNGNEKNSIPTNSFDQHDTSNNVQSESIFTSVSEAKKMYESSQNKKRSESSKSPFSNITRDSLEAMKSSRIVKEKEPEPIKFNKRIFENRKKLYDNYLKQKKQLSELRNSTTKALDDISTFKRHYLDTEPANSRRSSNTAEINLVADNRRNTTHSTNSEQITQSFESSLNDPQIKKSNIKNGFSLFNNDPLFVRNRLERLSRKTDGKKKEHAQSFKYTENRETKTKYDLSKSNGNSNQNEKQNKIYSRSISPNIMTKMAKEETTNDQDSNYTVKNIREFWNSRTTPQNVKPAKTIIKAKHKRKLSTSPRATSSRNGNFRGVNAQEALLNISVDSDSRNQNYYLSSSYPNITNRQIRYIDNWGRTPPYAREYQRGRISPNRRECKRYYGSLQEMRNGYSFDRRPKSSPAPIERLGWLPYTENISKGACPADRRDYMDERLYAEINPSLSVYGNLPYSSLEENSRIPHRIRLKDTENNSVELNEERRNQVDEKQRIKSNKPNVPCNTQNRYADESMWAVSQSLPHNDQSGIQMLSDKEVGDDLISLDDNNTKERIEERYPLSEYRKKRKKFLEHILLEQKENLLPFEIDPKLKENISVISYKDGNENDERYVRGVVNTNSDDHHSRFKIEDRKHVQNVETKQKREKDFEPSSDNDHRKSKSLLITQKKLLQKKNHPQRKYNYDIHGRRIYIAPDGTTIPVRYLNGSFAQSLSASLESYWDSVSEEAWSLGAKDIKNLKCCFTDPSVKRINRTSHKDKEIFAKAEEKIQQQLIEGMFKYAESKYGRKRPQRGEKQNAMEDYDLYLRSMKAKVKTVSDKLAAVQKQKKDIDAKVAQAEKDFQLQQGKLDKAEEEKKNAVDEGRDPILPKDFIVPQRAKKANAGLGALVMKASSKMWEDQFSAMRSKKKNESTPDWLAKQKKTDKTSAILSVGRKKTEKKGEAATPQFANALKKSDGGSRRRRKEEEAAPNPFKVNLKKTGLRNEEEDDKPSAKAPVKETPKPEPTPEPVAAPEPEPEPEEEEEEEEIESSFSSRRRQRRRYDSDEDAW